MNQFNQIDTLLTTDKVYRELKNAILKRTLIPGQKLDIFQLAEQFNVSRTPVKEAFNRLQMEGLLVIRPRKGTYVAEIDLNKVAEVFDARLLFETWAAQVGIPQASEEEILELRALSQQMDDCYKAETFDFFSFNELDNQFHQSIVRMGRNQSILDLYKSLNAHRITERAYYEFAYEKAQSTHDQHYAIVEAYIKRDVAEAVEQITKHIVSGKQMLAVFHNNR